MRKFFGSPVPKSNANYLAVQLLGLYNFTAEGRSSIPGHGTKMPQAMKYGPPKKKNAKWIAVQGSEDVTKSVMMAHECLKPDSESLVQDSQESWQKRAWVTS